MRDVEREAMGEASRNIVANFGPERFGRSLRACVFGDA
jgi:hypothetical protein